VLAGRLLNRWLSGSGDYQGLASWPWYLTYRALVRAKVLALQLKQRGGTHAPGRTDLQQQLGAYLHQAWSSSQGAGPAALILTHGVSGSGKSHLATQLCQRHGWIHLRSDVERRRLFGLWGTPEDVPRKGERYSPSITAELYGTILPRAADAALQAGLTTIVDATFLKQSQRATFLELAKTHQAPLVILMCPVSLALARERISQRRQTGLDPSEADDSVLTQQWSSQESPQPSEGIPLIVHSLREAEDQLAMVLPSLFKTTR
jgi:predicted kinase